MNTKIWLEELSFASKFGNFDEIESSRVKYYFLIHIFKIKKMISSISSIWSRDTAKSLKISFGFNFVSLYTIGLILKPDAIIFIRSEVLVYTSFADRQTGGRTDRRTDGQTLGKSFYFCFLIENIYTSLYLSWLFLKFHPLVTKVSILFFHVWK